MRISCSKYHGLGNCFVIARADRFGESDGPEAARACCDRDTGIGADGLILVGLGRSTSRRLVIYNRDGTRPEMCGNGVRCAAAWLADRGEIGPRGSILFETDAGPRACRIEAGGPGARIVRVAMGAASVRAAAIGGRTVYAVDVGNPHAVVFERGGEEEVERAAAEILARRDLFPAGANVEFAWREGAGLKVVVLERGVGFTRACGTGAVAVAAAAWSSGLAEVGRPLEVRLPGGALSIEPGRANEVWMVGNARRIVDGTWHWDR